MNPSGVIKKKLETGSRINIWKQDPTVREPGVRTTFVHNKVYAGPSDSQIAIKGFPPILPDINGDFLFPPPEQYIVEDIYNLPEISEEEQRFDAAHTYAVVRKVLTMYQRVLGRELKWVWNSGSNVEPLSIHPHANLGRAAFYDRSLKSLNFQYFYVLGKQPVFTCRSIDVVSHETGHAIFDSLKPYWNVLEDGRGLSLAIAALQESLCDLTSIFFILSQLDLVEYIIAQTKANLRYEDNILATWGEELGVIPGYGATRNAVNNLKLSEAGTEIHRISQVFTGAVYDMLSEMFKLKREPDIRDDAETLYRVSQHMLNLLVESVIHSPDRKASFADVANEMIKITEGTGQLDHAELIRSNFIYRDILTDKGLASPFDAFSDIFPDYRGCCGTLNGAAASK
jgi:hypothetical protein